MPGDLHNHSTCSDGSVPIHRLPLMAARAGLDTMAISDHDTLHSVRYCYEHPVQDGVRLIPATELTGYDYERQHRVHLLCYWPQDCPQLRAHCDIMRQRRNQCCLQSARELEAIYPQFTTEQALEYARDSGVLYKSGIMQALHELGLADSIYGEVYHRLFGWQPRGTVLHSPEYFPVEQVIATARAARAVLVFAHPTVYKSMPLVRRLAAEGQLDGIEIDHPRNSEEDKEECRQLCRKYGLIVTGGTDFHGSNSAHPRPVGTCVTQDDQIERINALAKRYQS
ncbi:MAG TPA: PHP domain-containing protein [Candidatus Faecalibacterium avium]|nr:PHP domain-containing protein [Candidatus Faecalibacterium avium]